MFYIQTGILNSRLNYYLINIWPSNLTMLINIKMQKKITKTKSKELKFLESNVEREREKERDQKNY